MLNDAVPAGFGRTPAAEELGWPDEELLVPIPGATRLPLLVC